MTLSEPMLHGGDLISASTPYGIPVEQWLDLSTGINPDSYPVGELDPAVFQRLPYIQPAFADAVSGYYGSDQWLAVNGSQPVIQALPEFLPDLPVMLPSAGYDEHRFHWAQKGNDLMFYDAFDRTRAIEQINAHINQNKPFHLMVINPNNPSGLRFQRDQLLQWVGRLPQGGYLIIDEAFIDIEPEHSVLFNEALPDNLIVLRSFGKFFGLAGLRLGFVFAADSLRQKVQQALGIWQVNGVAQAIATDALADRDWQRGARYEIAKNAAFTAELLAPLAKVLEPLNEVQSGLFSHWRVTSERASELQEQMAQQGVLVRYIPLNDDEALIRFGIVSRFDWEGVNTLKRAIDVTVRSTSEKHEQQSTAYG